MVGGTLAGSTVQPAMRGAFTAPEGSVRMTQSLSPSKPGQQTHSWVRRKEEGGEDELLSTPGGYRGCRQNSAGPAPTPLLSSLKSVKRGHLGI